jgi:quercetin dioxygenase-like cupin family protein
MASTLVQPKPRGAGAANTPPASMRPRRCGVVVARGEGTHHQLQPGISLEVLIGENSGALNLATGFITIEKSVTGAPCRHPHYAAITLLTGAATVVIGTERVALRQYDNLVIYPGQSHTFINNSTIASAFMHVSYPTAFPRYGPASTNRDGAYLLTRYADAKRSEISPGALFIDHFGMKQIPGIRMCGGIGTFAPGARLPAHLHDFDESICIVDGDSICWAEGDRLLINDCQTALQPRGRVHYFINETDKPMTMIWVYAGPTPQRIVVDEKCATEPGYAWQERRG